MTTAALRGCLLALSLTCLAGLPLQAQFDLGRLRRGLEKVNEAGKVVGDSAKEAAKIAKGVAGIGPEEERLIGESVSLEILSRHGGLWRDEAATERVNLIGRALAHYSNRPALPWRFALLDSPAINGFAAPGGYVFLTRGLYQLVGDSDDALAAVLAHEIAHVTERHALRIIARGELLSGVGTLAARHTAAGAMAKEQLARFDAGIADLVKTLLEQGFDADTEFVADQRGRALAVTLGYAPGALRQVLLQLQQRQADGPAIFSTHPSLAERLQRLPRDQAAHQP